VLFLVAGALCIVFLAENARIPVDDPNTHLELTMIHEVMVLDHGGIDLAYVVYGSAIKFWLLGSLLVGMIGRMPSPHRLLDYLMYCGGMVALAIIVGVVESVLARLRLIKVPHLLLVATALSILAVTFALRYT
jgi:formate hydrogenlyase subunit 4